MVKIKFGDCMVILFLALARKLKSKSSTRSENKLPENDKCHLSSCFSFVYFYHLTLAILGFVVSVGLTVKYTTLVKDSFLERENDKCYLPLSICEKLRHYFYSKEYDKDPPPTT